MRTRMPVLITALALAATGAMPSDAMADKTYRGKSQQRGAVSVLTGDDNVLKRLRVSWLTRRCAQRGTTFEHTTLFIPEFDSATPGAFRDAGSFTVAQRGGIRSRVSIATTGIYEASTNRWHGTVQATIVVRREGRVIDRCALRKTYFTVTAA